MDMMSAMGGGMGDQPCANPNCTYLAHTNPEISPGFCCQKCEGSFNGEEWALGGKQHYKHCEKRENPSPTGAGGWGGAPQGPPAHSVFRGGVWQEAPQGGRKRTYGEGPGAYYGPRDQQPCRNPDCEYLVHSDPSECANFCCLKCEGRFNGEEWAMGGAKKHYAQCEKRSPGDPAGFSTTKTMNESNNSMMWGGSAGAMLGAPGGMIRGKEPMMWGPQAAKRNPYDGYDGL